MKSNRGDIIDWSDQGRIAQDRLREALELAGVLPGAEDWRRFFDRLLLFMGVVALGAGVIFFLAFNWQDLGRFGKFALVEVPIAALMVLVWRIGIDSMSGKAALLLASLLAGALLALVGQTYQTGADTYELFAAWAAAMLPWTLLARFPALWITWLALLNLAVALYFVTFGLWGMLYAPEKLLWLLFAVNTAALAAWEGLAAAGIAWLRERWSVRFLATASGGLITALGVQDVVDWRSSSHWGAPLWLAWIATAYLVYRHWVKDVYVLAGGVLSAIVMTTTFLAKQMAMREAGYWLKQVATEEGA